MCSFVKRVTLVSLPTRFVMQELDELSDSIGVAMLLGISVAVLLIALWFILSLVTWDFSVSPLALRALVVLTTAGSVVGYLAGKFASRKKDSAPASRLRLMPRSSLPAQLAWKRQQPHSVAKHRPAS